MAVLKPAVLDKLVRHKPLFEFKKHERIYSANTPIQGIYVVQQGAVKLIFRDTKDPHPPILRIVKPGQLFGIRSSLMGGEHFFDAETVEKSQICFIPKRVFQKLVINHPEFSHRLLRQQLLQADAQDLNIRRLSRRNVRERVIETLLYLQKIFGQANHQEIKIGICLTREEIAQLSGTVLESVVRALTELEREGLIRTQGKDIYIRDSERLQKEL